LGVVVKKLIFIMCLTVLLLACSGRYSSSGELLYLKSHNGVMLEVPPPLTKANISNFYNLPPQNQDAHVRITPPK
jgi:uncharacterized lipoprotein